MLELYHGSVSTASERARFVLAEKGLPWTCRPSLGNCTIAATWFEYAPDYEAAFDDLLTRLRATPEWAFVEREVDIRLEGEMHNGTP